MNSNIKTLIFWVILVVVAVFLFAVVKSGNSPKEQTLTFTEFLDKVKSGEVKDVYVADKANLRFAHLKQDRQGLVTFSLDGISNSLGTEVSGMLGFRMLYMLDMKIDYRDGLVDFTYTPVGSKH